MNSAPNIRNAVCAGLLTAAGLLVQSAPARADKCQVFDASNLTGTTHTMTLPTTTSTSPLGEFYASTSTRRTGHYLSQNTQMYKKASSVVIEAFSTDVALYLVKPGTIRDVPAIDTAKPNIGGSGDFFDGYGMILHCPQGFSCTYNLTNTGFDNNTTSFICQREFYRKSHLVLPGGPIRDKYAAEVTAQVRAQPELEGDSPWSQYSTVSWMPGAEWCQRYGQTWCTSDTTQGRVYEPYIDHLRLHSDFMVNPDAGWFGNIFVGDYRVALEHFVRPAVETGSGLTNAYVNRTFWWYVVVEGGTISGTLRDKLAAAAASIDAGAKLTSGIYDQVGALFCGSGCTADQKALVAIANLTGIQRLQLSHRVADASVWNTRTYNSSIPPDVVLNRQRNW